MAFACPAAGSAFGQKVSASREAYWGSGQMEVAAVVAAAAAAVAAAVAFAVAVAVLVLFSVIYVGEAAGIACFAK